MNKLDNIAYFDKILKIRWVKMPNLERKKTLSKIAAPGPTSWVSIEVVLSNKDESHIGQIFMRNLNRTI